MTNYKTRQFTAQSQTFPVIPLPRKKVKNINLHVRQ